MPAEMGLPPGEPPAASTPLKLWRGLPGIDGTEVNCSGRSAGRSTNIVVERRRPASSYLSAALII